MKPFAKVAAALWTVAKRVTLKATSHRFSNPLHFEAFDDVAGATDGTVVLFNAEIGGLVGATAAFLLVGVNVGASLATGTVDGAAVVVIFVVFVAFVLAETSDVVAGATDGTVVSFSAEIGG